jgi:hypothetical protein
MILTDLKNYIESFFTAEKYKKVIFRNSNFITQKNYKRYSSGNFSYGQLVITAEINIMSETEIDVETYIKNFEQKKFKINNIVYFQKFLNFESMDISQETLLKNFILRVEITIDIY